MTRLNKAFKEALINGNMTYADILCRRKWEMQFLDEFGTVLSVAHDVKFRLKKKALSITSDAPIVFTNIESGLATQLKVSSGRFVFISPVWNWWIAEETGVFLDSVNLDKHGTGPTIEHFGMTI